MPLYLVRLWLPDRPGALGQVASRIGSVRADVVGIEILERGGGRAIDELVVSLPDDGLVDLLVNEIAQVDGVDVEDVRPAAVDPDDAAVGALAIAEQLVAEPDEPSLLVRLCDRMAAELDCDWVTVVRMEPAVTVAACGDAPSAAWLAAFLHGSSHLESSADEGAAPPDLAWAALPVSGYELAAGRRTRPFRRRERCQLTALVRVADALARRMATSPGARLAGPPA
jgi:hypothetical protein